MTTHHGWTWTCGACGRTGPADSLIQMDVGQAHASKHVRRAFDKVPPLHIHRNGDSWKEQD